jgi:hypothetical protein
MILLNPINLSQLTQAQLIAQTPKNHEGDDIRWILGAVQNAGAALIKLLAAVAASEPAIPVGRALRSLRNRRRTARYTVHVKPPYHPTSGSLIP